MYTIRLSRGATTGVDIPDGAMGDARSLYREGAAMGGTAGQCSRIRGQGLIREKNIVSPHAMVDGPDIGVLTRVMPRFSSMGRQRQTP